MPVETPFSLLQRLREPADEQAWSRLVQLYSPLLYHWLVRQACPRSDIDDVMQDVFLTLSQTLPNFAYDPNKGFRRWLRTVAVNKWRDRLRKRKLPVANDADQAAQSLAAESEDPFWESEYRSHIAHRALEIMKGDFPGNTWHACWQVVVEGRTATEVAAELGMTVGAVHAARFRVLQRVRQELAGLLE